MSKMTHNDISKESIDSIKNLSNIRIESNMKGCPYVKGEDCFGDLNSCYTEHWSCEIY